jgi:hypothetical protein
LILVDVWPLDRVGNTRWLPLLAEKIPFFLLSIADSVATYVFQTEGGGVAAVNPSLGLRLANAVDAYARYLWLTVFPRGLTMFYPYRGVVVGTKLPAGEVAAAFVVLIAMTGVAIALWRRTRAPLVGWLWFLGCLVPMIGIVQVGEQSMADRYTYFPHIGLWAGLVFGFAAFAPQKSPWARGLGIICVVAAVIFAARSSIELGYWKNERTLYTHAVAISDHNPIAHACLGYSYSKDPETATDAEREYHIALDIDPKDAFTHMNLANLLQEQGRLPEAISHYQYTVEVAPRGFIFHYNYGLGLARNNRERDALRELEKAVELAPDHSGARYALGLALINTGQRERALPHLHRARDLATAQKQEALLKQINDLLGGK